MTLFRHPLRVGLRLYVSDVEDTYARAVSAGATRVAPGWMRRREAVQEARVIVDVVQVYL
jgi:hypothetical protein